MPKEKILTIFTAISLLMGAANAYGFAYWENKVYFLLSGKASAIRSVNAGSFIITGLSISDGQDPDDKNWVGQNKPLYVSSSPYFSFDVGHHHTSKVANWFSSQIPPQGNTFGHEPGELNFAFLGTLSLTLRLASVDPATGRYDQTVVFNDIALAQGRSGSTNNWWFGGKDCKRVHYSFYGDDNVTCVGRVEATKQEISVTFARGDTNSVDVVTIIDYKPGRFYGKTTCGTGYVAGVWANADGWDDWGLWLSATSDSYSNKDTKFYRANSQIKTNYDSGMMALLKVLSAQASGERVQVLADGGNCVSIGTGSAEGTAFDSVQAVSPPIISR